jgi:carbon monoxide dehydrogenase subunit G
VNGTTQRPGFERDRREMHPARRRCLLLGAALAGSAVVPAWAAPVATASSVSVERYGSEIRVSAQAQVDATCAQAWSALADYDRLADFIPGVALSRTLSRTGSNALIEQRASASFGPFRQEFRLVLAVQEVRFASIHAAAAGGDFRRFDARYDLASLGARTTRIDYRATLEPIAAVPPLVGLAVMRGLVRRQFEAMLEEIGRRAAAA